MAQKKDTAKKAPAKSTNKSEGRKKVAKARKDARVESEYNVVRAANKMVKAIKDTAWDYNEKYIQTAIAKSKSIFEDVKKNAGEAYEGITGDTKKLFSKIPIIRDIPEEGEQDQKPSV